MIKGFAEDVTPREWRKFFEAQPEALRREFAYAVGAWHGTNMVDNDLSVLPRFAKAHPEFYARYREYIQTFYPQEVELFRGFAGVYADEIAEKAWKIHKAGEAQTFEVKINPYTSWAETQFQAKKFSEFVIIRHTFPNSAIFHADQGRKFMRGIYPNIVKLGQTEREVVIEADGIMIDPLTDIEFRGKFRARELNLKKKNAGMAGESLRSKLKVGLVFSPKTPYNSPMAQGMAEDGTTWRIVDIDGDVVKFSEDDRAGNSIREFNDSILRMAAQPEWWSRTFETGDQHV